MFSNRMKVIVKSQFINSLAGIINKIWFFCIQKQKNKWKFKNRTYELISTKTNNGISHSDKESRIFLNKTNGHEIGSLKIESLRQNIKLNYQSFRGMHVVCDLFINFILNTRESRIFDGFFFLSQKFLFSLKLFDWNRFLGLILMF